MRRSAPLIGRGGMAGRPDEAGGRAVPEAAGRWFWGLFLLLTGMVVLPFLTTRTPALLDYPNHLARVHVLLHWAETPAFQQFYEPHWAALPNLAFDVLCMAFGRVMPTLVLW